MACKYFSILLTAMPTDPGILSRLGQTFVKDDDESQAFHYHSESYRHYPVNLEVISWLGVWYVKSEMYERAIQYFERAAEIQPKEVKWRLMVTSCYRRLGSYQKALELYEEIHKEYVFFLLYLDCRSWWMNRSVVFLLFLLFCFVLQLFTDIYFFSCYFFCRYPQNLECLRYLVAICKELGMPYDEHEQNLRKLERAAAQAKATQGGLAGGILTQMNQGQDVGGQQNYGGRGRDSGRDGGRDVNRMAPIQDDHHPDDSAGSKKQTYGGNDKMGGKAPGVSNQLQKRAIQSQRDAGSDDEFADADIDDLWAD